MSELIEDEVLLRLTVSGQPVAQNLKASPRLSMMLKL